MIEIILLILFVLVFVYLAWHRLDWAVALTIALLPTYLLRFQLWFVPMTVLETMLLAVFVVWLVRVWSRSCGREVAVGGRREKIWLPWRWELLAWVLVGTLAVLLSPDIRAALGLWKAYIVEPVLFFIVFINVIRRPQQIKIVFWALGALVVVIGFFALLQYLGIAPTPIPYASEIPPRATGPFPFPTAIGKLVGPLVALFLGLWFGRKKSNREVSIVEKGNQQVARMFLLGVIGFGLLGLIMSVSRGALVGVFAATIFISFFSPWKKGLWLALAGSVTLALLIPQTRDNITGVFQATDTSTDVHLVMWRGAWRIIEDKPITGTGLASFPVVYNDYKEASHTEYFPNPDHLLLTLWIEMGLAGVLMFIWLVVKFFTAGISYFKKNSYVTGLFAAMIAVLVHGFLDTPFFKNDLAVEWWVLIGLLLVICRPLQKVKNKL